MYPDQLADYLRAKRGEYEDRGLIPTLDVLIEELEELSKEYESQRPS